MLKLIEALCHKIFYDTHLLKNGSRNVYNSRKGSKFFLCLTCTIVAGLLFYNLPLHIMKDHWGRFAFDFFLIYLNAGYPYYYYTSKKYGEPKL